MGESHSPYSLCVLKMVVFRTKNRSENMANAPVRVDVYGTKKRVP